MLDEVPLRHLRRREWLILGLVLALGLVPRVRHMADVPLWVDEAETSINALSILSHGVPRDTYLGEPIFENTLSEPWPESKEFEFRDTSYSRKGMAIYHGWLPLYALAASFALHGVAPDESPAWTPRHSLAAMRLRTRAARTPALVFSTVFLICLFFAARRLYGMDAAWAALAAGTVSNSTVTFARQARYYSITLALTTLCCLALCLIAQRGRRRDYVLGAVALVLLFHANSMAALVAGAVGLLVVPFAATYPRDLGKGAVAAAILLGGTVPWMLYSGFLAEATGRPVARSILTLEEAFRYPLDRWPFVALAVVAVALLFVARRFRETWAGLLAEAFLPFRQNLLILVLWAVVAFGAFVELIPAASFFHARLTLLILVPSLLFGAMLFAGVARVCAPRHAAVVAPLTFVAILAVSGKAAVIWPSFGSESAGIYRVIDRLRQTEIAEGTRLYTTAGDNLILRFYTGMPFQSVIAVRKEFFDTYSGDMLILESPAWEPLAPAEVQGFFLSHGRQVSLGAAAESGSQAAMSLLAEDLRSRGASAPPMPDDEGPDIVNLVALQRRKTERAVARTVRDSGNPMFRGFEIRDYATMWQVFFYRFVSPRARMGSHLNYADRIRDASTELLPLGWILFRCPAGGSPEGDSPASAATSPGVTPPA